LIENLSRNAYTASLGNAFKPRGDVDPITENVSSVLNDVSNIDAHAKFKTLFVWNIRVSVGHAALDFHCAVHCLDCTCEFRQKSVACGLDHAAFMFFDFRRAEGIQMSRQLSVRALFVRAHKPTVVSHICCQDSRQTSVWSVTSQELGPNFRGSIYSSTIGR
jgi:hypothetical protein